MALSKKILIVSTVGVIYDGISNVILSYLKSMDRSGLDIYIAVTIEIIPSFRRQFEKLKCTLVEFPNRRTETMNYTIALAKFVRNNKIEIIHAHGNSGTLVIEMFAAWIGGCKKRIAHSHNTRCDQVKLDKLLRPIFYIFCTEALACGEDAGKWLYNNKKNFQVLKNGRDVEYYKFNPIVRETVRTELNIQNELAIGHVGGFYEQKNHDFLVEIYRQIRIAEPESKLFMIGDGPLKETIEKKAEGLDIIFTGTTDRVSDYINAMDGMLLPSLFEGLPLVALEWQINGLPCILADTITNECALTDLVNFMSLDKPAREWAARIITLCKSRSRNDDALTAYNLIANGEYDINSSAEILKKIYLR